ncbi:hypothetical protein B0H10DRAFT_1778157, partial [Mycena sp. CBHHK59/15]
EPGEWRADLHDLLVELQSTNAALTGPVKLAIRDPQYPDHRVYFAKVTDDALLDEVQPVPPFAVIPSTDHLEIFVDHPQSNTNFHPTFDVADPNAKPLEHARLRAANNAVNKRNTVEINGDVEWLAAEIKTLPGYSEFEEHRRKVQQNPGVVASWKFMALVSDTYFRQPSHITNKKIQKQSIQQALGVGSTSLAEAENAVRILKHYGEGGSSPAQAVIDRIALKEDKPQGAKILYPFLVNWEKSHS